MINPFNVVDYQINFWNETSSGTKGVTLTCVAVSAVGLRILSSINERAILSLMPKNFTVYESIGVLSFLMYLIGSTFAGFLSKK
ncbi:MAG TPA: hypothetical protein VLE96_03880 [Chlamydiales bacterium]|nr:hypothetical protein [Chlamydiales bacterium]